MPVNTKAKRVFWFDDRKTPNVADVLEKREDFTVFRLSFDAPEEKNWSVMETCHAYCITSTRGEVPDAYKGTHELIEGCRDLLVISTTGAGYDPVDVAACTDSGVIVVNQAGANAQAVAEHVIAMMLSLGKKIPQTDRSLRTERGVFREVFKGRNAHERTVGIVGLGHVGRRVAGICEKGIDMRVLAYDPYLKDVDFKERRAIPVELDELLTQADYVSIHCPLNDETRGMIGHRELSLMQPDAFLINTARGGIVDEDALADALAEGRIAGAGVDVWVVEPPPLDHRLLSFDNVIATYHTAGVTVDSRHNMAHWNAQQMVRIFNGERPPRLINPEAWALFLQRFTRIFGIQPPR
ncbi:MAG TPA: hydroxyacid dehydrogenase [Deltaproteobacteria bacterium]|nr:hydroxyacid dehydrogenase [Deltaproteobacteria bacterium]